MQLAHYDHMTGSQESTVFHRGGCFAVRPRSKLLEYYIYIVFGKVGHGRPMCQLITNWKSSDLEDISLSNMQVLVMYFTVL